ncbi:MAG: thioredoxin [Flavobacteriia bacterium]|nr:thioredoxin [Flavobacteriia bacterium]
MSKFKDIISSPTPTLVDFFATWCGPCQTMMPILDKVKKDMGEQIRILKVDVDKNQAVANQFKVKGVPTFVLFQNGEMLWRQSGGMDFNTFLHKIKSNLK